MYDKGFLGNMTENLQADCVQSRQAGFIQCFPKNGRNPERPNFAHFLVYHMTLKKIWRQYGVPQNFCSSSAYPKIGWICLPSRARATVSGSFVKSATIEAGFSAGASCRRGTK